MKANTEKLKELSLAELVTIYRFCKDKWDFLNSEYSVGKTNEKSIEIMRYYTIGSYIEKMIEEKLTDLIIE